VEGRARWSPHIKGSVVFHESQKLKEHERDYATHDLELEDIIHALKMWRNYLMERKFELRTYHYGLKHLFGQPTLSVRHARWMDFLSEYDFEINHIKGKENQVTDALSRRVHEKLATTISTYMNDLKYRILEATN
jgi:hypothetical protein